MEAVFQNDFNLYPILKSFSSIPNKNQPNFQIRFTPEQVFFQRYNKVKEEITNDDGEKVLEDQIKFPLGEIVFEKEKLKFYKCPKLLILEINIKDFLKLLKKRKDDESIAIAYDKGIQIRVHFFTPQLKRTFIMRAKKVNDELLDEIFQNTSTKLFDYNCLLKIEAKHMSLLAETCSFTKSKTLSIIVKLTHTEVVSMDAKPQFKFMVATPGSGTPTSNEVKALEIKSWKFFPLMTTESVIVEMLKDQPICVTVDLKSRGTLRIYYNSSSGVK
jgi:hypothetical protein